MSTVSDLKFLNNLDHSTANSIILGHFLIDSIVSSKWEIILMFKLFL